MIKDLPLFPVSMVGSWPRTKEILDMILTIGKPEFSQEKLDELVRSETLNLIQRQEKLGVNVIVDGELNRDNYVSYVSQRFGGIKLMDIMEMSDYLENSCSVVEMILSQANAPVNGIKNAVCVGKLEYNNGLAVEDLKFLKAHTDKPVKIALPGPYLLSRSMWVPKATMPAYESREEMAEDVLKILIEEIKNLQAIGVDVIQIDEPVLTEIVFTEHHDDDCESFMCSVLSQKKSPEEEMAFATDLNKRLFASIDRSKSIASLHTCRGNWGKEDSTMLTGSYDALIKCFEDIDPDMLTLEFSTPRAGELADLFSSEKIREKIILNLGVINPRNDKVETVKSIIDRAEEAMQYIPKERIWLSTDCGFGTFSNSPISRADIAENKLRVMGRAARSLREKYGK